jgi:hypothetical protein
VLPSGDSSRPSRSNRAPAIFAASVSERSRLSSPAPDPTEMSQLAQKGRWHHVDSPAGSASLLPALAKTWIAASGPISSLGANTDAVPADGL